MVFQQFNLLETKTVYRNVAMPLLIQGASKAEIDRRVDEVLKIVELEDKRNASIRQLSGGQKQRVGIARALSTQPSILLCDEATSALDPKTTESILALLKKINREMGVTILLITHQMHVIQRICTKVAVMEAGRIVERGNVLDVFTRPREPITQDFVRTVVNDQIPEPLLEMVQAETRPQELLRLRFVGDTVRQPLLASLSRIEGLEVNILGATVEELQESVLCLFLVQLIGDSEPVRRAQQLLDDAGILRERIAA
jgi:D-methionine transport system ATP-binding protein